MIHRAPYPIHPGEMLREDVLKPMGMTISALARALHVPVARMSRIVSEKAAITPDTSLRLARYFGCSEGYWMRLQARYDMDVAMLSVGKQIKRQVKPQTPRAKAA